MSTLGLYVSVPFCRAKCTFCNFASGVGTAGETAAYVARVAEEICQARAHAAQLGAVLPDVVESIYFGGGTPSLLTPYQVAQLSSALHEEFHVLPQTEWTLECAPGQVEDEALTAWMQAGCNRVSLGVQSFIDRESAAVGRLHTGALCLEDIKRLRTAGVPRLGLDLICGLPHQTRDSWLTSLDQAVGSGVEHISVYMLEVDADSRLGREALAGGGRYGAHALPPEDAVADWYLEACERLGAGGLPQYEISNFGQASCHNVRYWQRAPYLGFGLDAHSMLHGSNGRAVRWCNPDVLPSYQAEMLGARGWQREYTHIDRQAAFEETLFLGLRMCHGVRLAALEAEFSDFVHTLALDDLLEAGLLEREADALRLTLSGRLASNEVFERLLLDCAFVDGQRA